MKRNIKKLVNLVVLFCIINIFFGNTIYAEDNNLTPQDIELNSPIFTFKYAPNIFINPTEGTVTVYCDSIMNHAINGKSGDLRLSIYLTQTKYEDESTILGCEIVKKDIGRLAAGEQIKFNDGAMVLNIEQYPAMGTYYATVLLEEYVKDGFYIVKYQSIDNPVQIPENPVIKDKNRDLNTFFTVLGAVVVAVNNSSTSSGTDIQTSNIETNSPDSGDSSNHNAKRRMDLERTRDMLQRQINGNEEMLARKQSETSTNIVSIAAVQMLKRDIANEKKQLAGINRQIEELN
jgi:hypothetical protein